eukprot:scaffold112_cov282-Prasinococcus_capsulatus_cf.AAC.14
MVCWYAWQRSALTAILLAILVAEAGIALTLYLDARWIVLAASPVVSLLSIFFARCPACLKLFQDLVPRMTTELTLDIERPDIQFLIFVVFRMVLIPGLWEGMLAAARVFSRQLAFFNASEGKESLRKVVGTSTLPILSLAGESSPCELCLLPSLKNDTDPPCTLQYPGSGMPCQVPGSRTPPYVSAKSAVFCQIILYLLYGVYELYTRLCIKDRDVWVGQPANTCALAVLKASALHFQAFCSSSSTTLNGHSARGASSAPGHGPFCVCIYAKPAEAPAGSIH